MGGTAKKAQSAIKTGKIESKEDFDRAQRVFLRLGLPKVYSLDKVQYTRGDVADIALRVGKKLEEFENLLDYERRKADEFKRDNVK